MLAEYGWKTVLSCPVYGYGGALGIVGMWSKQEGLQEVMVTSTQTELYQLIPQFNSWSRELIQKSYATTYALTSREMECMQLVAEGCTSKEIGEILSITSRTADFHIKNAMEKLGSNSRSQAAWRLSLLRSIKTLTKASICRLRHLFLAYLF